MGSKTKLIQANWFIFFAFFLKNVFSQWQLYDQALTNSVTATDLSSWNLTPSLYQCTLLTGAQEYCTQQGFGQIGQNQYPYKRYDNLPPHAAVIIDLSILFQNTAAPPLPANLQDQIQVIVDGSVVYKKGYKNLSGWITNPVCTSIYESIDYVASSYLIHNNPSLQVSIRNNFNQNALTQSKFTIRDFKIFLNLCDSSCVSCQNTTPNICSSCSYFTGAYLDPTSQKCVCPTGYYMSNTLCVASCPQNTVAQNGSCVQICDPINCLACSNQTTCTSCKLPMLLQSGQCVSICSAGYMQKTGGICQQLSSVYANGVTLAAAFNNLYFNQQYINSLGYTITKLGPSATTYQNDIQFSYCGPNKILGGYLTLSSYSIQQTFTNIPAHSKARIYFKAFIIDNWNNEQLQVIIDGNQTNVSFNNLDGSQQGSNICGLATVNDQIYEFDTQINHTSSTLSLTIQSILDSNPDIKSFGIKDLYVIVSACPQFCQVCTATQCTQCMPGMIYYNQQCYQKCPDSLYFNGATCVACNPACATCDPAIQNGNNCLTCQNSRVNNPPYCGCYKGFYDDGINKNCQACRPFCIECTSYNQCSSCQGNRVTPLCTCPTNTYDNNQAICAQCNYFCNGCTGPSVNDCIACQGNRIFPGCSCPPNTLENGSSLICPLCNPGCISCSIIASNCSGCSSTTRTGTDCHCKPGMMETYQNDCIQCSVKCKTCSNTQDNCNGNCAGNRLPPDCSCPQYYYDNNQPFCVPCPYQCANCNIAGICTQCSSIRTNLPNCVCPTGYFDSGVADCQICSSKCQQCVTSSTNCTVCGLNRSNPPACGCSPGYYEDPISQTCLQCYTNCATCTGNLQSQCLTCLGNRINNPQCNCPPQTYDSGTAVCPSCYRGCTSCFGALQNQCISCTNNRQLSGGNQCICKYGYYDDNFSQDCLQCSYKCLTCNSFSVCTQCAANRVSLPNCDCPQNSFEINQPNCLQCPFKCLSCDQITMKCITCKGDRSLQHDCLCQGNTFDDGINVNCQQCYKTCQGCFGPGPMNCIQCKESYQKSDNGICVCDVNAYEDNGLCVCKTSFVMKNSICVQDDSNNPGNENNQNQNCIVQYCKMCYKNTCLQCQDNRVLIDNKCVCINGFYQITQKGQTYCQPCSLQNCSYCAIEDKCEKCNDGFVLTSDLNQKLICLEVKVATYFDFPNIYIFYIFLFLFLAGVIPIICKQIYVFASSRKKQEILESKREKLKHPSEFRKEREKYQQRIQKKQIKQSKDQQMVDHLLNSQGQNNQDDVLIQKKNVLDADNQNSINNQNQKSYLLKKDEENSLNNSLSLQPRDIIENKNNFEQMQHLDNQNTDRNNLDQLKQSDMQDNNQKNQSKIDQSILQESNLLYSRQFKQNLSNSQKNLNHQSLSKLKKQLVS
ncbi:transmembrane protein, putative (macronuclear) [Tetrahymena thermophila SB210]|uniref:Transmembrane protein, putative n=1 Tax=Tetrahymena thermophila (strain SB210) TaxID=312017 RepID=Q24G78_TETTS|nr:transmembrane protein, putative [Tetrahymena thermophila SB210]EAS06775.3 transmembrane protein, putative [Tetrahymena thermophila SB210]|eukprot:XP_001027017.3 transmembrane protein, putative [Tetrahymena thermophila SB210]